MGKPDSEAERFIGNLEGLLQAARQAAAATLLCEETGDTVEHRQANPADVAGTGAPWARWTLHRCSTERRGEGVGAVVQFLGEHTLYEGRVCSLDWTESPIRIGARAGLAALGEWAAEHALDWEFGLGDVLEVPTERGKVVVAIVGVRWSEGEKSPKGDRWLVGASWQDDDGVWAGARAVLHACQTW